MELRKKLYTPAWRDPKYLKAQERNRRFRPILASLTVACLLCLVFPDKFEYSKAISLQLAAGGWSARILFGLLFVTTAYLGVRLWVWGSRFASLCAILLFAVLLVIAFTDPLSPLHNTAFVFLSLGLCGGHAGLFYKDIDGRLFFPCAGALGDILLCIYNLGLGERLLVASSCIAVLVLYYGDLDP